MQNPKYCTNTRHVCTCLNVLLTVNPNMAIQHFFPIFLWIFFDTSSAAQCSKHLDKQSESLLRYDYWTDTRHVCTRLNVLLKVNPNNMAMKNLKIGTFLKYFSEIFNMSSANYWNHSHKQTDCMLRCDSWIIMFCALWLFMLNHHGYIW